MMLCALAVWTLAGLAAGVRASEPLIQVREDFSRDPGWEGVNNRIVCRDCPVVRQNFGWRPGQIGGEIWRSTTPAWYGLPLGRPLTFDEPFSASGKIVFRRITGGGLDGRGGAAYLGFFNSQRQGWRPWSSVAIRLIGETADEASLHVDYMTAKWGGYGDELQVRLTGIGKPHTWSLAYDPEAGMPEWPDPRLKGYLTQKRQTAEEIYAKARKTEAGATQEGVRRRLEAALENGLVRFFHRPPHSYWTLNEDYDGLKGRITAQFDGGRPHKFFLLKEHRASPLALDRFGIFNLQMYHGFLEFYVSDLTVNGHKIDLAQDPHWDGRGNQVEFVERDFQRQDFGYSQTNWAGGATGEMGGLFYRSEAVDPMHGFYADDVGELTLEDPVSFTATANFVDGATDAGMFLGYFNARERMGEFSDKYAAQFLKSTMGLVIEGPTRVGYYLQAQCTPTRELNLLRRGPVFLPGTGPRRVRFAYDPAGGGSGRITAALDGEEFRVDLTPRQRAAGATFDRFGLTNVRRGGKYVRIYFDDLEYTARRPAGAARARQEQKVITVPYPPGGRKY